MVRPLYTYKGTLEDVQLEKGLLVTYSQEEAKLNLAYEGNYSSMMTPMMTVRDSVWLRAGNDGNIVYYDKVDDDSEDEYGHAYIIERLRIDSTTSEIVAQERIYTLDDKPMQHIVRHYSNFTFDQVECLVYDYPEGFKTVANADLESQEEKDLIKAGDRVPEFDLVDTDGNAYSEETIRGKKAVFVFSFIGCGGCELARKHLAKAGFYFDEDYVALYVNPMNTAKQIANYHENKPWPFKLAATDYDFSASFGVSSYPTFITVDESGTVEEVIEGYDEDDFMDYFEGKGGISSGAH
jgi:thioredoxin-related protein